MKRAVSFKRMIVIAVGGLLISTGLPTRSGAGEFSRGSYMLGMGLGGNISALPGFVHPLMSGRSPAAPTPTPTPTSTPPAPTPTPAPTSTPRYVAIGGIDAGACSNSATPCQTISYAIGQANAGDTVNIAAGEYFDHLTVSKNLTLKGVGAVATIIDGGGLDRVFDILPGVTAQIAGMTIRNGLADQGGGIHNAGTLTVSSSVINGNVASSMSANASGGGIHNDYGTLILINTTVSGNRATASGSFAGSGGGIISFGIMTATNSTFSGNTASDFGGGIYSTNGSTLTLASSTISANSAGYSGGGAEFNGTVKLKNTILAGNLGPAGSPDCDGYDPAISQGYNLLGDNSGCMFTSSSGDLIGTGASPIDPLLGPLENNGGTILTQPPLDGSPAIDQGNPSTPGSGGNACPATDQIGTHRPQGARCDIGAVEIFPVPAITSLDPASATAGGATFTLTINGSNFATGAQVHWNGANRTSTFISSAQLKMQISAADIAVPGTATITVINPTPGGGASNAAIFAINNASGNPTPTISGLTPSATTVGGAAFLLTVSGTNFVSGAVVRWNGANRTTTFVSGAQLRAQISPADIAAPGTAAVTVLNPAPGGGVSNVQPFIIKRAMLYLPLITTPPPPPTSCEVEPNDTPVQANLLTIIGQPCAGSFDDEPADPDDLYKITVATPRTIAIDLTNIPAQADYTLALYDSRFGGDYRRPPLCRAKTPGSADEQIVYPNAAPGTYYIGVFPTQRAPGVPDTYLLRVSWDNRPAACTP